MKTFVFLCAILLAVVSSCSLSEAEISIHRHYSTYPQEESVSIYERGNSNNPLITITGLRSSSGRDYYYTRCVKLNTEYVVGLYDSENDGWSLGSYIDIAYDNQILANHLTLSSGGYNNDYAIIVVGTFWYYFVIGFVAIVIIILIIRGLIKCCKG